jgi:GNAT superfamily N-acetyltransferase
VAPVSFHIRKADTGDAAAILACLAAAFQSYRDQYTSGGFADTVLDEQTIHDRLRQMCVFVAVAGERVVGTIGCDAHGDVGHLRGMAVLPQAQGAGAASALLHAAEEELRSSGCTRVTLDTTEPLQRAVRFYARHGYAPSGKVANFFGMPLHEYAKSLVRT